MYPASRHGLHTISLQKSPHLGCWTSVCLLPSLSSIGAYISSIHRHGSVNVL